MGLDTDVLSRAVSSVADITTCVNERPDVFGNIQDLPTLPVKDKRFCNLCTGRDTFSRASSDDNNGFSQGYGQARVNS
jgi:hypothetical protein